MSAKSCRVTAMPPRARRPSACSKSTAKTWRYGVSLCARLAYRLNDLKGSVNGVVGERPMVLIVDDSDDIVALIGALLRSHCRTKSASSGEAGIQAALADPVPDLILLD